MKSFETSGSWSNGRGNYERGRQGARASSAILDDYVMQTGSFFLFDALGYANFSHNILFNVYPNVFFLSVAKITVRFGVSAILTDF